MLLAEAKCNKIKGTASRNRSGLGFKARQRVAGVSADKVQRAELLRIFGNIEAEKRLVEVMNKRLSGEQTIVVPLDGAPEEKQGNYFCGWLRWCKDMETSDMRWAALLRKDASYIRLLLNSLQDSLPTPSRLSC